MKLYLSLVKDDVSAAEVGTRVSLSFSAVPVGQGLRSQHWPFQSELLKLCPFLMCFGNILYHRAEVAKGANFTDLTPFRDLQRFSAKCLQQNVPYPKYTACRRPGSVLQLPMALLNIKMKQFSQNQCCVPPEYFDSISHHYASRL